MALLQEQDKRLEAEQRLLISIDHSKRAAAINQYVFKANNRLQQEATEARNEVGAALSSVFASLPDSAPNSIEVPLHLDIAMVLRLQFCSGIIEVVFMFLHHCCPSNSIADRQLACMVAIWHICMGFTRPYEQVERLRKDKVELYAAFKVRPCIATLQT